MFAQLTVSLAVARSTSRNFWWAKRRLFISLNHEADDIADSPVLQTIHQNHKRTWQARPQQTTSSHIMYWGVWVVPRLIELMILYLSCYGVEYNGVERHRFMKCLGRWRNFEYLARLATQCFIITILSFLSWAHIVYV